MGIQKSKFIDIEGSSDCIEESQFEGNLQLEDIAIPCNVRIIKKNAFKGCINLKSVWLPEDGLEKIEDCAFEDCVNLVSMVIPNTLETIAATAFQNCPKVKFIYPEFQLLIPDDWID